MIKKPEINLRTEFILLDSFLEKNKNIEGTILAYKVITAVGKHQKIK